MHTRIKHVAIIMDGNGRWASQRGRPRFWGHVKGATVLSPLIERAESLGVRALTLFTFSTENWARPKEEVMVLFRLLHKFLMKERKKIIRHKARFRVVGSLVGLPRETKGLIEDLEKETENFEGIKLNFAFSYGGRQDIVSSVNEWIKNHPGKELSCEELEQGLVAPDCGDVDLLIRTGGEQRISNFLLWQAAYAELFFTKTMWPLFSADEFQWILAQVSKKERRFGGLGPSESFLSSRQKAEHNQVEIAQGTLSL